ncbi:MAG: hypothetical protein JKY37_31020, partial [Nannocystaceae bacterium]|nr:hypothetical protein [Nannocystaceae bacterium]
MSTRAPGGATRPPPLADAVLLGEFDPVALASPSKAGAPKPALDIPAVATTKAPNLIAHGPIGPTSAYPSIHLTFDQPMVAFGAKKAVEPDDIGLVIAPALAGELVWASPTRLEYVPDDALPDAQRWRVTLAHRFTGEAGQAVDVNLDFDFETDRPSAQIEVPGAEASTGTHWKQPVIVRSDEDVSHAELRRRIRATARPLAGGVARDVAVRLGRLPKGYGDKTSRAVRVRPVSHWPAAAEITIIVDAKLKGRGGP